MAQLPNNRRKAVLAASATAVLAGGLLVFTEARGWGGPDSWGQFALGGVVGVGLVLAVAAFVKWRSGPRPGDDA
jgi:phosphate/sulfate permease